MKLPVYSVDLIKELDAMYPDRCPDLKTSDREIWFQGGQRSVVRFLLSLIQENEEAAMPDILNKEN
jgi:hypothetical protein